MDTFVDFDAQWFYHAMTTQIIESATARWHNSPTLEILEELRRDLDLIDKFYRTGDRSLVDALFTRAWQEYMG